MKYPLLFSVCFVLFSFLQLTAQYPLITNVPNRQAQSLNGKWHYIIDPYENGYYDYHQQPFEEKEKPGNAAYFTNAKARSKSERIEYNFEKSPTLLVPGSWNTQASELLWYEGTIWYQRDFIYHKQEGRRTFLYFGAANYQAHVYVIGQKVGSHTGGFTPFNFEVTEQLEEGHNFVVVKVDNSRKPEAIPTVNTDWWNHGGLTRAVQLIETPKTFIRDFGLQLAKGRTDQIQGFVQLDGNTEAQEVLVRIPEAGIEESMMTDAAGWVEFSFSARGLILWDTDNPKLYAVEISSGEDRLADKIGFRSIETRGADILLNGKKLFLRGICMHEENPVDGRRNNSRADAQMMMDWVEDLNANFIRLSHYPHNEHTIRLADERGILLWEEVPVYWAIHWENEHTLANALNQLQELITRDRNRASVIIWSMANETPLSEARNHFLKTMAETARSLDDTRLVSAAMQVSSEGLKRILEDPFGVHTDIISFNQYHGWYGGRPDDFSKIEWEIKYDKPVVVSEWGGGALYGFHADKETVWSEEYQEHLYQETLKGIDRIPGLSGFSPWILADFRSPRRPLPEIQDMWNRKGLISEGGHKKKAFMILQDYYRQVKDK